MSAVRPLSTRRDQIADLSARRLRAIRAILRGSKQCDWRSPRRLFNHFWLAPETVLLSIAAVIISLCAEESGADLRNCINHKPLSKIRTLGE